MKRKTICRTLLASAAALPLFVAAPAFAQVTEAAETAEAATDGGEITVTARRREESLIEVPIAVTAYSGEALELQGALDILDIGDTTPNVTLEASRGTNSTLTAFIRGVGQQDPVAGFEQGVGIYLDDVYLNRPQAAVLDIYDVERIEVLRGPQGTLYGRNTIGGAIKYVTKRLADKFSLSARATYGTYNQAEGVLTIGVPVGDGTLRFGGSLARLARDGFGDNLTTGQENYNKDVWAGRLSAEIHAQNAFFRLAADYTRDKSNPRGGHRLITSLATAAPVLNDVFDTRGGLVTPKQDIESYGISLFGEASVTDWLTFRSITAYRKDDSSTPIDFDALAPVDVDVLGFYNNEQFSQEVQALIEIGGLNGLVGGYFLDAKAATPFEVRLYTTNPVALPGLAAFTNARADTETYAIFGDFTYDFTKQFSISVGGRYTVDRRDSNILRQNFLFGGSPFFGTPGGVALGAPATNFQGKGKFTKFTPRASISFKPTPDHNLYASYSQGFKGGGFDPRGVGANAPDTNGNGTRDASEVAAFLGFRSETVDSYEIGYKASLFDRRLNFALAAFRADYSDVQIPGSSGCVVGGIATFCGVVTNAGKARFQGIEFEGSAKLARDFATSGDALTLSGSLGYIDAKFRRYITNIGDRPTDVAAFRRVQNTPEWTASGTLTYATPLGSGRLNATTTVSYRSKTFQFEIPNPFIDQKAYALWDASLVYRSEGDRFSFGLHAKNILDKEYKSSGYTFLAADATTGTLLRNPATGNFIPALGREGVLSAFYGNPRQVFVTAGIKF